MRRLAAVAVILLVLPTRLRAQDSDDEWLENCRDGRWGDWGQRARHCEIRETGMKATSQPLHIDPGMNGGVEIIGWNKSDSIAVTARIQVHARTQDDADAIARDIKIEVSGGTVRATGGSGLLGRHQNWSVSFIVMVPRHTNLNLSTENGPLSVQDVSGQMDLWIPGDYNAKVEFGTVNGPMDVGFPMTVTLSGRIRNRISTTLGNGGPLIRVVTTNGPMTVRRSRS